jgi:hypothetical protein
MQEIAQATNNFADFNEIMPAIYRNFMEREAREWRMIYKVRRRGSLLLATGMLTPDALLFLGAAAARVSRQARLGACRR